MVCAQPTSQRPPLSNNKTNLKSNLKYLQYPWLLLLTTQTISRQALNNMKKQLVFYIEHDSNTYIHNFMIHKY